MSRLRRQTRLCVALNGHRAGILERAPNGSISFTYDAQWLADESRAIPLSLSMPLREERYSGSVVATFFDHLLPDNPQIRSRIAQKVGAAGSDAFSLLDRIGRDCVGALQFLPPDDDIPPPGPPESTAIDDGQIAQMLRNLDVAPLGIHTGQDHELRISIAGAQEKTALLWADGWRLPVGGTPTTHILKPALGQLRNGLDLRLSVQNEHFCLALCRALGLQTARSTMARFDDMDVLVVERFDRLHTRDGRLLRLPQEDFCQAQGIPASFKYNHDGGPGIGECLTLLNGSDYAEQDRHTFLRAQVIFWLMGATDGHAKNYSLFLGPGGRYRMTPLYDIMSLQPHIAAKQVRSRQFKLAMAAGTRRHYLIDAITPRHFLQSAKAAGIAQGEVLSILNDLRQRAPSALTDTIDTMPTGFPAELAESIAEGVLLRLRLIGND